MSSPAQLSQPFDVGSSSKNTSNESDNSAILHLSNVDMYESQFNATIGQDTLLPADLITSKTLRGEDEDLSLDDSNEFDQDLMVPTSNNNTINNNNYNNNKSSFYLGGNDFESMSMSSNTMHNPHNIASQQQQYLQRQFETSRNLYIDDGIYSSQLLSGNNNLAAGFEHQSQQHHHHQSQSQQQLSGGRYNHQQNFSISSNFSINQEPPSQHIPQSISTNTLYSVESIPQLSSSISNQSLSDSPSSLPQSQQQQQQQQQQQVLQQQQQHQQQQTGLQQYQNAKQQITATPRKGGRKKSLSVSSTTNLYNTPLRIPVNAMSPVNLANPSQGGAKIGKTPHSTKGKGHSRSRSRMSIDVTNTPANAVSLLNSNLTLATKSSSIQNLNTLDPFYTPSSYISPHPNHNHKNNLELDDIGTPLLTPKHLRNNNNNGSIMSQNTSAYFSPVNPSHLSSSGANTSMNSNGLPFVLKRHDTLESIKIEDQDDDALKQLKKAKSYSSITNASKKLSISSSTSKQTIHNINELGNFNDLNTLNLQIPTQQELQQVGLDDANLYSSSSTPGMFYSQNSPSVTFGQPLNLNEAAVKSLSVPNTANDYDANVFKPNTNKGIDLLSPSFVNANNEFNHSNQFNKNLTKNLNQSSTFTKSYPASIDLASIATSPVTDGKSTTTINNNNNNNNQNIIQNDNNNNFSLTSNASRPGSTTSSSQIYSSAMTPLTHTTTNTSINNNPITSNNNNNTQQSMGLLPPMATFPVASQQQDFYNNYSMPIAANVMTGASTLSTSITQTQGSHQDIIVMGSSSSSSTMQGSQLPGGDNDDDTIKLNNNNNNKTTNTTKSKKSEKEIDIAKEAKKRHKCPICDSRFQRPEHVKRHLKSHSSEKPFECDEPECGKRFNRKDNLKAHLKKIHQRTTFNL
ncbi:hypothetical protein DFJ63DRAFT_333731 [Scheffersomyces coipomensis]|uniref:uncharacterized protein n=1 Tax=Scheffersomyces coipomensis TaxID=1788519 RepID=UPI00315D5178